MGKHVKYRMGHGWGRPKGLCLICGKSPYPLVHDHCHRHGWVRGAIGVGICNTCNGLMASLDRGALPGPDHRRAPEEEYVRHWLRCPDCRKTGWRETTFCACDHDPGYPSRYECVRPADDPVCPWLGTGFRPLPPAPSAHRP
ncbi:endonuclease domain-containing protein [Actinomadura atramentaria]|uniref:endonuclease domain-containing protein n=1 Tax=Actinomadura atramentaria TaxID=1990 RepID=UPI0003A9E8C6|nr:endonuclease domain-containing protein [Actinomadura atramentaria]